MTESSGASAQTIKTAFVVMQVGPKDSKERQRADEIYSYIVKPALEKVGLKPYRADLDPAPGSITPKMLKELIEAEVVIADLTGRNPNVFYEFGIAHSFARPIIVIADSVKGLPFDTKDERVIELGDYVDGLTYVQGEEAKRRISESLDIVLTDKYDPPSPLKELAGVRSLDQLAPDNPIAAELAQIREGLDAVLDRVTPRRVVPRSLSNELSTLRNFIAEQVADGNLKTDEVESLITEDSPVKFDEWVRAVIEKAPTAGQGDDPWGTGTDTPPWGGPSSTEEPPF